MIITSSQKYLKEIRVKFQEADWKGFHKLTHSYISEIGMLKPSIKITSNLDLIYQYKGEEDKKEEISMIVDELETQIEKIIISLSSDIAE